MDSKEHERKCLLEHINQIITKIKAALHAPVFDKSDLTSHSAALTRYRIKLETLNSEIASIITDNEALSTHYKKSFQVQDEIFMIIEQVDSKIAGLQPGTSSHTASMDHNNHFIRLPKLELKSFEGDPLE